jgi:hypothetical protein
MLSLLLATALIVQDDPKALEAKAKEAIEAFTKALKEKGAKLKDDDVIAALEELGKTQHPKVLDVLKTWLGKGSTDIRIAAAREIGRYSKNKAAADLLMKAAGSSTDAPFIAKCLEYAAGIGLRDIAKDLTRFFEHKSPDVAAKACDAAGTLKAKVSVAPLIDLARRLEQIRDDDGGPGPGPGPGPMPGPGPAPDKDEQKQKNAKVLPAALQALNDILGEKKKDAQEYAKWWAKNQGTWKEPEDEKK